MKKVILLVFLLFLAACVEPYDQPVEPKPVEVTKVVVRCADGSTASSADACPKVEEEPKEQELEAPEPVDEPEDTRQIAQVFLDEALENFDTHAYLIEDRLVVLYGNKSRHYFLKLHELPDGRYVTDVYVDSVAKTATGYCDIDRESRMETRAFDYERSKCKDHLDEPFTLDYKNWIPKGPLDYLREYKNYEPTLIENNTQTISIGGNSKTVQPTLHYDIRGDKIVVRMDKRYKVPIKIEKNGVGVLDFRDAYFDVMVVEGKPQKITKDWVEYQGISDYWLKEGSK